ncbi:hypothetical protein [Thiorhodovibrio frisius]|uniref:Uncharacterized protein n=1 Tax=Thiorhodovibrio frisius TaxID=631362 RepID=H8YVF1_9GAMM|nr:hypothetical protein [Thiorhodovibrio frisius]EIC23891.1 hypothetical protein Thi970DRAFT_00022 [Thiorhodovibrio frisius]WPL23135.1 hypothetical protein Thiofri_03318 [Thiorhodovibrio frisius]
MGEKDGFRRGPGIIGGQVDEQAAFDLLRACDRHSTEDEQERTNKITRIEIKRFFVIQIVSLSGVEIQAGQAPAQPPDATRFMMPGFLSTWLQTGPFYVRISANSLSVRDIVQGKTVELQPLAAIDRRRKPERILVIGEAAQQANRAEGCEDILERRYPGNAWLPEPPKWVRRR